MKAHIVRLRIQKLLGVTPDGIFGKRTRAAFDALALAPGDWPAPAAGTAGDHVVKASSFADPADVRRFRACKARGGSDQQCFKVGDNGLGCWGDDTTAATPMCALPPEDMEERWGSVLAAKHARVLVTANGRTLDCQLADRMPRRANIKNGAGLDLNPAAATALGLHPPFMVPATWRWG